MPDVKKFLVDILRDDFKLKPMSLQFNIIERNCLTKLCAQTWLDQYDVINRLSLDNGSDTADCDTMHII